MDGEDKLGKKTGGKDWGKNTGVKKTRGRGKRGGRRNYRWEKTGKENI